MLNSVHKLLGEEFFDRKENPVELSEVLSAQDFVLIYFGQFSNPGSFKFTEHLSMFY